MDNKSFSKTISAMSNQLNYLKINGFPGLCKDMADIIESSSFLQWNDNCLEAPDTDFEYGLKCEELVLVLPFAGTRFTIKLYFNLYEPWTAPDFVFGDTHFMQQVTVKDLEEMVPSLNDWDSLWDSKDIIGQLLMELYQLYKKYQLGCLEGEEVLQFEYESILETLAIGEDDVEISLSGANGILVSILLRLPLDLKNLPPVLIDENPGSPTCLLHVTIKKPSGTFTPKLHMSPQVENLIGGCETIRLPSVPAGASLCDYVDTVCGLLQKRLQDTLSTFDARKQFIVQLMSHFGRAFIEFDEEHFCKASLLLSVKEFHFLLIIYIPENFPKALPELCLRSVCHSNAHGPLQSERAEPCAPPGSTPEEVAVAVKARVFELATEFQTKCVNAAKTDKHSGS